MVKDPLDTGICKDTIQAGTVAKSHMSIVVASIAVGTDTIAPMDPNALCTQGS